MPFGLLCWNVVLLAFHGQERIKSSVGVLHFLVGGDRGHYIWIGVFTMNRSTSLGYRQSLGYRL